jgi:ABC-2 type transport system permease protein
MYRRALREALRVPTATLIVPIAVAVFLLTIFARVFERIVALEAFGGLEYAEYVAPAAVVLGVMSGCSTAGVSTAVERSTGFYDRMRIAPLREVASIRARRLADGSRLAAIAVALVVVAWIDGVDVESWPLALAVCAGLAAAWGVAYGGLPLAVCLRTGSAESAQAMVPLFFPILFMSTAIMPSELLPDWLAAIADWNPVSYICDAMRAALQGEVDEGALWRALAGIGVVGLVTQVMVWRARAAVRAG